MDVVGLTRHILQHFPIKDFNAVYVLDLCEPLLEVSRKRFEARGFKNVQCLLQDATHFTLPEWSEEGVEFEGGLDFVTMSYSLRCEGSCSFCCYVQLTCVHEFAA